MLAAVRTVAPAVKVVSLDQARMQCRIDSNDEDELLSVLIDAAVAHFDGPSGILGRALITQTWRQDFPSFADVVRLPVGTLIAVSSVSYYDANNASQTLSSNVYTSFNDEVGPYLTLKPLQSWPPTYSREDAVRVTWTAGYGSTADLVPAAIRQAMLLMISNWYSNRGAAVIGASVADLPFAVSSLISPYRRVGV